MSRVLKNMNPIIIPRNWETSLYDTKEGFFKNIRRAFQLYITDDDSTDEIDFRARAIYVYDLLITMVHDCPPNRNQHLINEDENTHINYILAAILLYKQNKINSSFLIDCVDYAFKNMGINLY